MRTIMIPARNSKRGRIVFWKMIRDSISNQDEIDLPTSKGIHSQISYAMVKMKRNVVDEAPSNSQSNILEERRKVVKEKHESWVKKEAVMVVIMGEYNGYHKAMCSG